MGSTGLLFSMAFASVLLVGMSLTAAPSSADFVVTSTAPGNSVSSANLTISNDKSGQGALLNITNFVPGDTATRVMTITNTGNVDFTYTAAASATANTLLWSDTTNGLRAIVYRCPSATPCTNGTVVYAAGGLKNLAVPSSTLAVSAVDYLTIVVSLPSSADNTFRNLTQDVTITFTATQLAGSAK